MHSLKNPTFRGGESTKNQCRGVDCLNRWGLEQFADLRGGGGGLGKKEGGGVFEGG